MVTISQRTIGEMKEVAYQPQAIRLEDEDLAYAVIRKSGNNLTIFPVYLLGSEYPKTYGHFHVPPFEEHYRVLFGRAGFLLQQMEGEKVTRVKFQVVESGGELVVPAGWGHVAINLGEDYLVTQDDHEPAHFANEYSLVKNRGGFGYFIVAEGEAWKAVPNPHYPDLPPLEVAERG